MGYWNAIDFGFTKWLDDRATWKYMVAWFIAMVAAAVVQLLVSPIPTAQDIALGNIGTPTTASGIAAVVVASVVAGLIAYYILALMRIRALQIAGYTPPKFGFVKFLRLIITNIAAFVFALFSIYRLRWLALGILGAVLVVVGPVFTMHGLGPPPASIVFLLVLGAILLIAYAVVVIYNLIRLLFADMCLLNSSESIGGCLRASENMTKGRVVNILLVSVVMSIVIIVIVLFVAGITVLLGMAAFLLGMATLYLATVVMQAVSAVLTTISNFFHAGLFSLVRKDKGLPGKPPSERVVEAAQRA